MATALINPSGDVVNGAAVVLDGDRKTRLYDNEQRTQHIPDTTGERFEEMNGRFVSQQWAADRGTDPAASGDTNSANSGQDAVVYLDDEARRSHVIFGVAWSYDSTPASGSYVAVESPSGTVVFRESVTTAGPGFFPFEEGLRGEPGDDVLVRLSNGLSSKRVSLMGRRLE